MFENLCLLSDSQRFCNNFYSNSCVNYLFLTIYPWALLSKNLISYGALFVNKHSYNLQFSFLSASIGGEIKPSVIKCPAAAQVS